MKQISVHPCSVPLPSSFFILFVVDCGLIDVAYVVCSEDL